jgi:phosphoribosylanthranilate isomerase
MKIKVCGMRDKENIEALMALKPDFMGFIFYPGSPRFAGDQLDKDLLLSFPSEISKTGVFVTEDEDYILKQTETYQLQFVQLHGNAGPGLCRNLKDKGIGIIKAFSVDDQFDFDKTGEFKSCSDYFLFDTKGDGYGGHGVSFNWEILHKYDQEIPFLLAGGINSDNIAGLALLKDTNILGIDVNSRFEISPGFKDIEALEKLFKIIRG